MTPKEQIEHWIQVRGACQRTAADSNKERCIYKATAKKLCSRDDLYAWAMAHRKDYGGGDGYCNSIWEN
jgi:hypothetical protein